MKSKELEVKDIFEYVRKIALSTKDQIIQGRSPKAPCIGWDKQPDDYTGFKDPTYGTAIVCDYISQIDKHLVVIDLDKPKKDGHIPFNVLEDCVKDFFKDTYTVKTGSGGLHLYFLSEEKPTMKEPNFNIDYLANTGTGQGRYTVSDYIYDKEGEKVHYTKLKESPNTIYAVKNTDQILNHILKVLEDKGYLTTPMTEFTHPISDIIKRNIREGHRNDLVFNLSGYLRKKEFAYETTIQIIRQAFRDDEELTDRLKVVDRAYKRDVKDLKGWNGLKDHLNGNDLKELESLVVGEELELKTIIMRILSKQKEPTVRMLSDYINSELTLYKDPNVLKYYEQQNDGTIKEMDNIRIEEFINESFGADMISSRKCKQVLNYVTKHIKRNYNLILFNNGYFNTATREFSPNKDELKEIPKLTLPFNWNPDAKAGRIGKLIDDILINSEYPNNKELWIRAVGHAFMSDNRIGKMVMVQGESGTGKSTLTTILKRIFTDHYSEIKTQTIVKDERFTLHPLIGKAINIDDDIANGMLRGIGNLNTIITGNGLQVEVKGENKSIQAQTEQIPKLFANGNTLPPVIGTGFERRLLLIHADNQISYEDKDEYLQSDILSGKYDKDGIEWLIYTAINTYLDKVNEPITTKQDEQMMLNEYEFKAYPLKKGIETIFEESYGDIDYIPRNEVFKHVKQWCRDAYNKGMISSEHKAPSIKSITKAMDQAGFSLTRKQTDGNRIYVYECIRLKDHYNLISDPQQTQTVLAET